MNPLDSRKYFPDATVAAFVDDVQRGNAAKVSAALKAGIDANAKGSNGFRPIHFVFPAKTAEVTEILLTAGADANAKSPNGNTPLHYAVQQASADFTVALLKHGADPKIVGEVDKPVLYVALSSPVAETILPLLVKAGANLNGSWGGYPPLQAAMVQQEWKSAASLIALGANPGLKTEQGETAAQTFCRLLQRMKTPAAEQRQPLLNVGQALNAKEGLPDACAQRLASFR